MEAAAEEKDWPIIITNIKWHETSVQPYGRSKLKDLPESIGISLPESIAVQERSLGKAAFEDAVEAFAYNFLRRRYGAEASYCQTWLYLQD